MFKKNNYKKTVKKIIREALKKSLNESYYCNGAGQDATTHDPCKKHGEPCINWSENPAVAGTMGQNINDPDDWQCIPNELNVAQGGDPLSADEPSSDFDTGTGKPNKNKQLSKLAARNMVKRPIKGPTMACDSIATCFNEVKGQLNEAMMCYTSVNHLFGVNFDGGDECKACGGCYIYPAQCNGTTTFDSIEECQSGTQRGGTRGTPGKGKDKGNVLQTKIKEKLAEKRVVGKKVINESYYCNGGGQDARTHLPCRELGKACINWRENAAGVMGRNINPPRNWECVPNVLGTDPGNYQIPTDDAVMTYSRQRDYEPGIDTDMRIDYGRREPDMDRMMELAAKNIMEPSLDYMMNEATANIICEREGLDDEKITNFTVTKDNGEIIDVNQNHELYQTISREIRKGKIVKQLTKGKPLKERETDMGREPQAEKGLFCCWLRGGCCTWEHYLTTGARYGTKEYYQIKWNACCGNSQKGRCC